MTDRPVPSVVGARGCGHQADGLAGMQAGLGVEGQVDGTACGQRDVFARTELQMLARHRQQALAGRSGDDGIAGVGHPAWAGGRVLVGGLGQGFVRRVGIDQRAGRAQQRGMGRLGRIHAASLGLWLPAWPGRRTL